MMRRIERKKQKGNGQTKGKTRQEKEKPQWTKNGGDVGARVNGLRKTFKSASLTENVFSLDERNCVIIIAKSLTRTRFQSAAFVGGPFYFKNLFLSKMFAA